MLKSLQIKDYALIEKIDVDFHPGLNIITGETGAGKSILIDAMGLLLGERASTEVIRKDAQKAVVEGIFNVSNNSKVENLFQANDIEFLPELIIRREVSVKGAGRCFINDTPVSLSLLKETGNLLVDLHGQHEHQSLLNSDTHITFLDEFGNYEKDLDEFKKDYKHLESYLNQLKELRKKEEILKEKKDLYGYQIKEIDQVSPEADEEENLINELSILENAEKLLESSSNIYIGLYESESAIYTELVKIKNQLEELSRIDKSINEINEECSTALTIINDIARFIRSYKEKVELDPSRLDDVRERLGAINLLKRKYGGSLRSLIEYRKKIGDEYEIAENYSEKIRELEADINISRKKCGESALALSTKRKDIAKSVESQIKEALSYLGIPDAKFEIKITRQAAEEGTDSYIIINEKKFYCNTYGFDTIDFFISTNKGESTKPLNKVASGGEISRIMLALKSILAKNDKLPLLIFDEIDTGVSGRIAQKVGFALKSLAEFHQIISITHLPQIASLANHHYCVSKIENNSRVISSIKLLNDEDRIKEIAKLLSGEEITETSLKGAKELLNAK